MADAIRDGRDFGSSERDPAAKSHLLFRRPTEKTEEIYEITHMDYRCGASALWFAVVRAAVAAPADGEPGQIETKKLPPTNPSPFSIFRARRNLSISWQQNDLPWTDKLRSVPVQIDSLEISRSSINT